MFATLLAAAAFVAPALLVRAEFTMSTPVINQCGQIHVTWDDIGKAPYNLVVLNAADPCGEPIVDLGDHQGTSMTWYGANVVAGQQIELSVESVDSQEAWTATITVGAGDNSCLSPAQVSSLGASPTSAAAPKTTTTVAAAKTTGAAGSNNAASGPAGAIAGGSSGASMASFSLPALALSAVVGFFTLL